MTKQTERVLAEGTAAAAQEAEKEAISTGGEQPTVLYGKQPEPQQSEETQAAEESEETFDDLIAGRYKRDFEDKVQGILAKRLKNKGNAEAQMEKLRPFLDMQARRAGVDANDTDAIIRSLADDSDFIDKYAEEHGYSTDEAKRVWKLESDHRQLVRQNHEREAQAAYQQVLQQAQATKAEYPSFDLNAEMQDAKFAKLVASGIDTSVAYLACHPEVVREKAAAAAANAQQQTVNAVAANLNRPVENGVKAGKGAIVKDDPSTFTLKDFDEIKKRVKNGERIVFD